MALQYRVVPLTDYTIFTTTSRLYSPFDSSWSSTQQLLERELAALRAEDVTLELALLAGQIRRDGMPRADAKVSHPGVRLSFGSVHGPLSYVCDRFVRRYSNDPQSWQINLRAIALGLEALRKVDRYGITNRAEQYRGFAELPAGTGGIALGGMTKDQALEVIATHDPGAGDAPLERRWKRARAAAHPDRHGGDQSAWDQVEQAALVLGLR